MSAQWFYIQQWSARRWSYIGEEMSFQDAQYLFNTLSAGFAEDSCKPLALVRKASDPNIGKVIQNKKEMDDTWKQVVVNAMFLNDGKDEPLLVKKVSNE